ncbi:alpha-galactosidase A, partial [Metarhizium hybridum]
MDHHDRLAGRKWLSRVNHVHEPAARNPDGLAPTTRRCLEPGEEEALPLGGARGRVQRRARHCQDCLLRMGRASDRARDVGKTWAYSIIARLRRQHPEEPPIAPDFIAHVTENGRIMGLLLQKVDGEPACTDDLPGCEALVRRLHGLGLIHGDVNRYNFLVDRASEGAGAHLVDFEHVEGFDDERARQELASLPAELAEETGRGSTVLLQ